MADGQAGDVLRRHVERPLEFGVDGDDVGAQQAGDVEGLGRGGELIAVAGVALPQRAEHRHVVSGVGEVRMDLIGQNGHAVGDADVAQTTQLVGAPHAADRVVRVAQHQRRAPRIGRLGLQIVEIHDVTSVVTQDEAVVEYGQAVVLRGGGERIVDGSLQDHLVAGMGDRTQCGVDRGHDPVRQAHPGRVDVPVVPTTHPCRQRAEIPVGRVIVSEDVMLGGFDQRFYDFRSRLEFHVGNGHGDHVLASHTHVILDHVPFDGCGAAPFDHGLEIVHVCSSYVFDGAGTRSWADAPRCACLLCAHPLEKPSEAFAFKGFLCAEQDSNLRPADP